MTNLTILLPEAMREFVEEETASGGYGTPSEYMQALIRKEQERKAQERLEALILEGLESGPPSPMTDADWDEMRHQFDERHRGRAKSCVVSPVF